MQHVILFTQNNWNQTDPRYDIFPYLFSYSRMSDEVMEITALWNVTLCSLPVYYSRRILLLSPTRYSNDSQCIHRPTLSYGPLLFIRYSHSLVAGRFGVWSPVIAHPSIPRQWPTQPCFTMGMAFTTDPHLAQNLNMGRTIYYLSTPPVPAWLVT